MLSSRCKTIVTLELQKLGFDSQCIELGTVHVGGVLPIEKWTTLKSQLKLAGLELMDDKKTTISDAIKYYVAEILNSKEDQSEMNVSDYLVDHMHLDYPKIAKAFTTCNQKTLKQYIILERVKKVKELIMNQNFNLAEISSQLHYSSTAHLCNEFKRIAGCTPKIFRNHV
jgi:AraC-like DNA-binding protein